MTEDHGRTGREIGSVQSDELNCVSYEGGRGSSYSLCLAVEYQELVFLLAEVSCVGCGDKGAKSMSLETKGAACQLDRWRLHQGEEL